MIMNGQKTGNLIWIGTILILLSLSLAPKGMAASVEIINPKGPLPSVVTTDQKTDQDAAADFCGYFSRVSGRTVAPASAASNDGVIIHVGRDAFVREHAPEIEKLFADGYVVKCVSSGGRAHIILAGRIHPSSQWAIEQFLKDYCGVRWLFPDPVYGEIVPSKPTITVDQNLSKKYEPDYLSRGNLGMYYPVHTTLRLRSHGYGYGEHMIQRIFNNGSTSGEVFAKHPEWFAFFKGKRQWWEYGNGWQICTTNPGTIEHTVKYVLDYFKKDPNAPMVSIGPNDGWGECECPECTKFLNSVDPPYSAGERWWHWVNQIAKEVKKTYPDKWVESMAYSQTSAPPRFQLESNVAITKTIVLDSELKQAEQWGKVCKSVNLYSYMYGSSFLGFRHYPHAAQDFLKWGHDKLGAIAHTTECGGDWTFDGPKYHYLQALQWDVNANVDAIMDEFCALSYGKAAKPMRDFWDRHEKVYENRKSTPYGRTGTRFLFYEWVSWQDAPYLMPNQEFNCYSLEDVEYFDRCITEASRLAKDESKEVQFRVARMTEAWNLVQTMLLSKLNYYDHPEIPKIDSEKTKEKVFDRARQIAGLRAQRNVLLGKMRLYPAINPRMMNISYWSYGSQLTIFSNEITLLDELCTSVSEYTRKANDIDSARNLWRMISPSDDLYESAQTQLFLLQNPKLPNMLENGNFEDGNSTGWNIQGGQVDVVSEGAYSGKYSLRMCGESGWSGDVISQKISVSPHERYRLTAWVRYLNAPDDEHIPVETFLEFYSGSKQLFYLDPMRCMSRTKDPSAGWTMLRSTVTVPLETDNVVIYFKKKFPGKVLWDDVVFEKIKAGYVSQGGNLHDSFDSNTLDANKWNQISSSGGFLAPQVSKGWLIYDNESMFPIVSNESFNNLLRFKGEERYCLKIHLMALAGSSENIGSVSWGIKTGTGPISISDSGMYWTHQFGPSKAMLYTSTFQNSQRTGGDLNTITHLKEPQSQVWYTLYFDPEDVTVYAASDGYDNSEKSLVTKFKHGINDIGANGNVYLKLDRGFYKASEISLTSSHIGEVKEKKGSDEPNENEKARRLMMPGVTE